VEHDGVMESARGARINIHGCLPGSSWCDGGYRGWVYAP
jgi:uncharacterized protein YraI